MQTSTNAPQTSAQGAGESAEPGTSVNDGARVFARVMQYQGKDRRDVSSPNMTARECIALANYIRASDRAACTHAPAALTSPEVPDGFKLVAVKGFDELIQVLDRAERKGYLPDAMADEWTAFDWRLPASAP